MSMHWIERKLKEIGRRKSELADALRIDRSRVSELLHGRRRISVRELPTISRFLEVPIAELVRLETGDAGHRPELTEDPGLAEGLEAEAALDEPAKRVYNATKEALTAFSRHGIDEMSDAEIDSYAKVIARCATRAEFKDARIRKRHLESKVVELKDFRSHDLK